MSWYLWALLGAFFAALTAILAKLGVSDVDPDVATFVRTVVVLLALGGLLLAFNKLGALGALSGRNITFLSLSGLATGASWLCYFRALKLGDASQVAPLDKLSVALVAVFAFILLGERISMEHWIGISLMVAGAILVAR